MNDDEHELTPQEDFFCEGLKNCGLKDYYEGRSRSDYPFTGDMRRPDLIELWQLGWDIGRVQTVVQEEAAAAVFFGDPVCSYTEPGLIAAWERGCRIAYGLQGVGSSRGLVLFQQESSGPA